MKKLLANLCQSIKITLFTLLLVAFGKPVLAQVYTPILTLDENDGNVTPLDLSLREAVILANQDGSTSIIRLVSGATYTLSLSSAEAGNASFFDLDILNNGMLIIETAGGTGTSPAIIRADFLPSVSDSRVFDIQANATLTLRNVIIENGNANVEGGGIRNNNGKLNLLDGTIIRNNNAGNIGGGIFNTGINSVLRVVGSTITGNTAQQGAGIYNTNQANGFVIKGSTISLNTGLIRGGGIVNNNSSLIITSATISENKAQGGGAKGGGVFNTNGATLGITCASIISNTSNSNGAGICNEGGTQLNIHNSFVSANINSTGLGTGIFNQGQAIISNSSITYNQGNLGAGIFNGFGGTMSIINNCVISYNTSSNNGGGIAQFGSSSSSLIISSATITNNFAYTGGGIFNKERMDITASSISTNTGGGIYHQQESPPAGIGQDLNIINSTISSNINGSDGGGIRVVNITSVVHLNHVTIADNKGANFGAIANTNSATVNLQNSIIGNNISTTDVQGLGVSPTITSNIVADGSVTHANIQNIDPKLTPLTMFSGSLIHRLLPASPALNSGISSPIILDQIGRLRNDGFPDIGAYEGVLPCENVIPLSGVDNVWLGCLNSDWSNANNWSTGSTPSPSDVILLLSGSPVLIIGTDVSCKKIIAQKGTKYYLINGAKIFFNP